MPKSPPSTGNQTPSGVRLYATVSALLTALICWPMFGGYLLYRDAVATPRFPLTPGALGIDGAPPRAVPQDAALAVASTAVDGGLLVAAVTAFALFAAGVGYGRLAERLVPTAGRAGASAAAILGIWNPYVAERLLQGHWSLLAGYAALGWLCCAVLALNAAPGHDFTLPRASTLDGVPDCGFSVPTAPVHRPWTAAMRWLVVAGLLSAAGLTPTGSVFALVIVLVTAAAARLGWRRTGTLVALWLVTASPWLVGAIVATGAGESGGAAQFALRAEPWLGTFGTALGLGGIWNAEAVPTSRTSPWAAAAAMLLVLVVAVGATGLYRRRGDAAPATGRMIGGLALLAGVAVAAVTLAATPPGLAVLDLLLAHVPGAGLLRDTQKYLALAVPFAAVAAAAAVAELRRRVPAGFAVGAVAVALLAPLPDLAWGAGGRIEPVAYPADYAVAVAVIGDDLDGTHGGVAVWPPGQVRDYTWANGPSLTPLPRMLRAPVTVSGELVIDGVRLDAPAGGSARVVSALQAGDAAELGRLGIGWVVVEDAQTAPDLREPAERVYDGEQLQIYWIAGAAPAPAPSTTARAAAVAAHLAWAGCLIAGAAAGLWVSLRGLSIRGLRRQGTRRPRPAPR